MKFVCRRCDNLIRRKRYRVTTEEGGIVLLNIVVCGSCARLAKSLGLPVVKLDTVDKAAKTKSNDAIVDEKRQRLHAHL